MTRLLLLLSLLGCSFITYAQVMRGNWYLSADASLAFSIPVNNGLDQTTSPYVAVDAPRVGYAVTDRLLVGSTIQASLAGTGNFSPRTNSLYLAPFVRYYAYTAADARTQVFVEGSLGGLSLVRNSANGWLTDLRAGVGAERTLWPGVVATASVNYLRPESSFGSLNVNLGMNLILGQLGQRDLLPVIVDGTWIVQMPRLNFTSFGTFNENRSGIFADLAFTAGYFITDKLSIEIALRTAATDILLGSRGDARIRFQETDVMLSARYYLLDIARLMPFVRTGAGLSAASINDDFSGMRDLAARNFVFSLGGGASYFLMPRLALDAELSYRSYSDSDAEFIREFNGVKALQLLAGVRFFL